MYSKFPQYVSDIRLIYVGIVIGVTSNVQSSHKNARALQKPKIKIIENMKIQTENFFGIII